MKNHQKGFIGILVIIIIALAVICRGAYVYSNQKSHVDISGTRVDTPETVLSSTTPSNATTIESDKKLSISDNILTEKDIYLASYPIRASFGGNSVTPVKNIIFPINPRATSSIVSVWITETGDVSYKDILPSSEHGGVEGFHISRYKYVGSDSNKANVWIEGGWGASANEEKIFTVQKINGKVTVKEGIE